MSQTKTSDLMPSQAEAFVFDGVATRILNERNRVGLSQEEFAKLGGASQPTQGRYEAGSPPKISYLAALAANGIDVMFILTGKRSDGAQAVAALLPSQAERYNLLSLGQRLRAERKRIGATQAALADMGGVTRNPVVKYENGENSPTVEFLYRCAENGLDAAYVFTGVRIENSLRPDEQILLDWFGKLPPHNQQIAIRLIAVLAGEPSGKAIDEGAAV